MLGEKRTWERECITCGRGFVAGSCSLQICYDCKIKEEEYKIEGWKQKKKDALATKRHNQARMKELSNVE
jgi:hypothetical protein